MKQDGGYHAPVPKATHGAKKQKTYENRAKFIVVRGVLLLFMVVHCGLLWFMLVYRGPWWFIVVYCGLWWFIVVYSGLW
jgi:hypothetical protein